MAADDVIDEQVMSPIGPKRHLVRRGDLVAFGGIADMHRR
jgi:hypothetical protein